MIYCGGHYIVNDDHSQISQKDTSSTNNQQPVPKNKKLKFLLITGVILLVIGLIMASIGLFTISTAKKVDELKDDLDLATNTYKSYDKGDNVIITGKIVTIIETKYIIADGENVPDKVLIEQFGGIYIYILEKNLEIYANEKIGEIGDTVYLSCEVQNIDKMGREEEILKANPSFNILLITGAGLVILILGIIAIFVVKRRKTALAKAVSKPSKIAKLYEDAQIDDEEAALYQFMQKKDQATLAQQTQTKQELAPGTLFSSQFQDDQAPQPTFQELPTIDPIKPMTSKAQPITSPLPIRQPKPANAPTQRTPTLAQPVTSPLPTVQPKPISGPTQRTPTLAHPVARTQTIAQPIPKVGVSQPTPSIVKPISSPQTATQTIPARTNGQFTSGQQTIVGTQVKPNDTQSIRSPMIENTSVSTPSLPTSPESIANLELQRKYYQIKKLYRSIETDDEDVLYKSLGAKMEKKPPDN